MGSAMFRGSFVALITPFRNGAIDEDCLQSLVEWHVEQGTDGLVPVGTTGESPTLSHAEHRRVVELVIEAAAGRLPVIAGAGSNATAEAIELGQHAKDSGADAILVVTPYYNKPTQAGLYAHYKAIHDAVDLPIIIYNIPGRSVVDMAVETMAALARLPNIVGVKDATCDLVRPLLTTTACGPDFAQLSGEDGTWLAFLAHGGHGCISVTANVAPHLCTQMQKAWDRGEPREALTIHRRLMPLHKALFIEANPGPVKYALARLGRASAEIRLPLVEPSEPSRPVIDAALVSAGLMN
jgi:4-hydroxy-tetrahydrodipicolinate synthase